MTHQQDNAQGPICGPLPYLEETQKMASEEIYVSRFMFEDEPIRRRQISEIKKEKIREYHKLPVSVKI